MDWLQIIGIAIGTIITMLSGLFYIIDKLLTRADIKRQAEMDSFVESIEKVGDSFIKISNDLSRLVSQHEHLDERSRDALSLARVNKDILIENTVVIKSHEIHLIKIDKMFDNIKEQIRTLLNDREVRLATREQSR